MNPFVQTTSGRFFPLIDPTSEDVHWPDVASGLAHINRYSGNAGVYTVAQHSIIVANQLPPDIRLYGLLHDAHEFAIGDMTRPMKKALERVSPMSLSTFTLIERNVDCAIYSAAGLPFPISPEIRHAVKAADLRAALTERRDVCAPSRQERADDAWLHSGWHVSSPLPETIVPWTNAHAQEAFYRELGRYGLN